MEKISSKIKKKLENIIQLKEELRNWKKLSEDQISKLIKEFEKTPRDEGSSFYNDTSVRLRGFKIFGMLCYS